MGSHSMVLRGTAWLIIVACLPMVLATAQADHCRVDRPACIGPAPTFAYGNAGFSGGYSQWVHRQAPPPVWCPTPRPACGPSWQPCLPRPIPSTCWQPCGMPPSCGWLPWGQSWGWYGTSRYACRESVFLSISLSGPERPALAMTDRKPAIRMSNADARRRARKLVAVGDRYLQESLVERAKLSRALSSYRRAATIAADLPEIYVRQAVALVALDRHDDASRAIATIASIDPRLQASVAESGLLAIREIWPAAEIPAEVAKPAANWIADRWSQRWHPEMTRLADAVPPAAR